MGAGLREQLEQIDVSGSRVLAARLQLGELEPIDDARHEHHTHAADHRRDRPDRKRILAHDPAQANQSDKGIRKLYNGKSSRCRFDVLELW